EINVPAWPIPIHHTKLTIAKPQPIGMLIPQIPTPLAISHAIAIINIIKTLKDSANPASHPRDSGRVKTIDAILSVTEAYVCPGSSTGVSRRICGLLTGGSAVLMPAPVPDSGCAPLPDKWYAVSRSIRPKCCSCAAVLSASRRGCFYRFGHRRRSLPRGKLAHKREQLRRQEWAGLCPHRPSPLQCVHFGSAARNRCTFP